ncbi:MAG: outer membrane lipoprotein carrier protein LolA [Gemmatimonadetes bacterium]|jgi:chaperone LolA|nr:outer membrane lipoprotein carrier protein LolA [Gemmatimonadota bacterium]
MTLVRHAVSLAMLGGFMVVGTQDARSQDVDGLEILESAAVHYGGVSSLCADFVQRLEIVLLGDDRTGSGRICQARPNKFGMRFSDPEGDLVIVDGESIWLYYPSVDVKQVIRVRVSGSAAGYDLFREFLERPSEKYTVSYEADEVIAGQTTRRLRLIPKVRTSYNAAVLWVDAGAPILRRIRIEEENSTVRTLTFADVELGPSSLDDSWFVFTPPPGAQVISRMP